VSALGFRKDEVARPTLEELLDADNAILRYFVVGALIALGTAMSHAALANRRAVENDTDVAQLLERGLHDQ
jgi:hypothetical protein